MKRTLSRNGITILISSLLMSLLVFGALAQSGGRPTPTPEKKINIEDTIARRDGKNKVTLKPEFEAAKRSDNSAVARKKTVGTKQQPGGIGGSFDCSCTKANGSCKLIIAGNSVSCTAAAGDCGCDLQIITK
jgi:hypothetical protein